MISLMMDSGDQPELQGELGSRKVQRVNCIGSASEGQGWICAKIQDSM